MALTYKVLGQVNPTANTATTLYTVPGSTQTVVSTIAVCNLSNVATNFRLTIQPGSANLASKHYLNYDTILPGNDTITLTAGITLSSNDLIGVQAATSTVAFSAYGSEIS